MSPKALVCARFRDGKRKKTGFISHEKTQGQMEPKWSISTLVDFLSRNASNFALKILSAFILDAKCAKGPEFKSKTQYTRECVYPKLSKILVNSNIQVQITDLQIPQFLITQGIHLRASLMNNWTELNWIELQLDFAAAGAKRATLR